MKDSMLLLLTFAIAGACGPVVLYTDKTAPEGSYSMFAAREKQFFLYLVLEQGRNWGDEKELRSVVRWSRNFSRHTWPGNIYVNLGNVEITNTKYGKVVFMERMQEIYEEACKNESMHQAILRSAICVGLFTIDYLIQSSTILFYPLLVDLLQALDISSAKVDELSRAVSAEICYGKTSICTNVDAVMKMLQQDGAFINSAAGVYELSELLVGHEPDLDTLRTVLSWEPSDLRDAYEWAKLNLDKNTQTLLVIPLLAEHKRQWRDALRSIRFRELKSFPNLSKHLKSIKINSSELGRGHLILMLLFPEQSEKLSLMVWDQGKSLRELFSILPLLPWQAELAMKLSWELYWDQSMFFKVLKLATHKPILNLAQIWFTNIFEEYIVRDNCLKEISSIWKCSLSQSVILHQLYLRTYASECFDEFVNSEVRFHLQGLGFIGSVVNNENFSQGILFDEILPKDIGTDHSHVIFVLRVLLTKVFDEKKLTRWIVAYLKTAKTLQMERSKVIMLILDEELAGSSREAWLAEVFSVLRLFIPDFVFDDTPYTSVVDLSASIRRQISLSASIDLIRSFKQQNSISAIDSFIPEISSKILAEIGISNPRAEQILTKLLRQTRLIDLEYDFQNSSEILDDLYSRIDQYSFLRLNSVLPIFDDNFNLLRVDEIIGSTLKSRGNSFIQTAIDLATFKTKIIRRELAGPNREVWLEMVSSTLRLFVPEFVFDDAPYTLVVELSASIRSQINLPASIDLIRTLKQRKGTSVIGGFIPEIPSKILAEIGIGNAWVVKQMLTKLLRQTQLLDIEGNYQNSSVILDNLYSRIDRYSFLRLIILDANLDPLQVDEIVRFILESHGNSFIQTAMAFETSKKDWMILCSLQGNNRNTMTFKVLSVIY